MDKKIDYVITIGRNMNKCIECLIYTRLTKSQNERIVNKKN